MDEQSKIALDRLNASPAATGSAPGTKADADKTKPDVPESTAEKPAKSSKKKQPIKLVLSDNEVSWEERRAALTRYQKSLVTDVMTTAGEATDSMTGPVEEGAAVAAES
jgi:hypothetical protein